MLLRSASTLGKEPLKVDVYVGIAPGMAAMAAVYPKNEKIKVPIMSNVKERRQKKNSSGSHDRSRAGSGTGGFAGKTAQRFEIDHQKKSIKNCSRQSGQVRLTFFKKLR
jgi:hypothetical protein